MKDYHFLHPFIVTMYTGDSFFIQGTGFRKRNHLIPCQTRQSKTMRRKARMYMAKIGLRISAEL